MVRGECKRKKVSTQQRSAPSSAAAQTPNLTRYKPRWRLGQACPRICLGVAHTAFPLPFELGFDHMAYSLLWRL